MRMGLLKYLVTTSLRSRNMWFWGIFWSLFWVIMGAFLFKVPPIYAKYLARDYMDSWTVFVFAYMPSGVVIGYMYSLIYGTAGVAYLRRFGRLTPLKYVGSYYLAMLIVSSILSAITYVLALIIMYAGYRYHGIDVPFSSLFPNGSLGALGFMGAVSLNIVFMTSLLLTLYIVGLRLPKYLSRISFIPMLLVFLFFYLYFIKLNKIVILVSPITALIGLMYSTYAGFNGVVNTVMLNSYNGTLMQPSAIVPYWEAALTVLLWTIALTSIGVKIVTSIRYAPPEEMREF